MMEALFDMENMTKSILYDLEKGNLEWEDEKVQYFLPVGLHFSNIDLLKVVAENTLIEEDNEVVQNFLDKVESICDVNSNALHDSVNDKVIDILKGL